MDIAIPQDLSKLRGAGSGFLKAPDSKNLSVGYLLDFNQQQMMNPLELPGQVSVFGCPHLMKGHLLANEYLMAVVTKYGPNVGVQKYALNSKQELGMLTNSSSSVK